MEDLLSHFYSPFFISEVLAALCASIFFNKYKNTAVWLIMPILWMAVIAESSGVLYYVYVYPNNSWIFNLYDLIFYLLFYLMIYNFVLDEKRKKIIKSLSALVLLAFVINTLLVNPIYKALTYASILDTIILVIQLMYAAIEALKSQYIFSPKQSLPLFIFGSYLIIELALIPISLIRNMDLHIWSNEVYYGVNTILGYVLLIANAVFIFGFIWTKPSLSYA